jgi:autotransporter-associated beta strand protein
MHRVVYSTFALGFLAAVAEAATRQWSSSVTTGSWATAGDWGGTIPGSADIAAFANISAATDVTLDGNQTISQINVTDTNSANVAIDTGSGGTLTLAGAATLDTTNSRTLTINAVLAGTAGLNKIGNGTVVLTNAGNTLTGGINVSAGTLTFSSGTLGTNLVTVAGGTLNWATGNTQDISSQIVVADGSVASLSANSQTITLASAFQTGTNGTGSVTKSGAGTFIITAANTYTGGTQINNGTFILAGGDNRLSPDGAISFGSVANHGILQLGNANGPSNQTVTGLTVVGTSNLALNAVVGGSSTVSTLTVNLSANDPFTGTLGGTGKNNNNLALTLTGTGTLTLSAANTYLGGTNVNSGTLAYGVANALPQTGAVNIAGGALDLAGFGGNVGAVILTSGTILNSSATAATLTGSSYTVESGTISAVLAGSTSALAKTGSGTVILSGANTYGGGTTIDAGTLALGAANVLNSNGALTVNGGTFDLAGFNVSVGVVILTNGGIINSGTGATLTASSYSLQSGTINAVIGGAGTALIKASDGSPSGGAVTLTAANTYTGPTSVNAGTLNVSTIHMGGGAFSVSDGATLGVSLGSTGQSLVTSALTLGTTSGGTLMLNLGSLGSPTVPVISAGTLTLNGTNTINITASGLSIGAFPLISYAGTIGGTGSLSLGTLPARVTANLDTISVPQQVLLNVTGFDIPVWTGAVNGNWNIDDGSGTVGTLNWKLSNNSPTGYYQGGAAGTDSVIFNDTATGTRTVNLTTTLTPNAITINNDSLADDIYTLVGIGKISGATSITKEGSGTLVIANAGSNDYSGRTTISGGVLQVGDGVTAGAGQLGSGDIILNGGTLALFRPSADNFTLPNEISGTGALQQEGGDTVTVAGNNLTFNGSFVVTTGTLKLGSVNGFGSASGTVQTGAILDVTGYNIGNTLNLNGGTLDVVSGTGTALSGPITLSGSGGTVNVGASSTLTISGAIGGLAGLAVTGSGLLVLSGNNSYAGPTVISGGMVQLAKAGALGGPADNVTVSNGGALDVAGLVVPQPVELNGGTLRSSLGTNGALSGTVTLDGGGGTVDVATGATLTLANAIGGSGALTKTSAGTLVLSGSDNFNGGTNLNLGTLEFATAASVPATGKIHYASGTVLAFGFAVNQSLLANSVASSFNSATLALGTDDSNNLDFTNYPGLSLGALASATYSGTLTPSSVNYYLGGGGGTLTFASQLTGAANLIVGSAGPGTVILTQANNFAGGTTVNAGSTLRLASPSALGPVANGLTVNGTLDLNGNNLTVGSLTATTGLITDNSTTPGTTALTDNTASGSTTFTGSIDNGANGRVIAFVKSGAGTIVFNKGNGNSYTGGTTITGGILEVRDNNPQVLSLGSNLTFASSGTFRAGNNGTGAGSLTLGTLSFASGEGTVQSDQELTGTVNTLTFASAPTRAPGATGNFTLLNATNPSLYKVVFTAAPPTGESIDGGIFFQGNSFAAYDSAGYVRGLDYASDSNALSVSLTASQASLGNSPGLDVQLTGTGSITNQGTDSVRTFEINGSNNLTLNSAAIFTVSAGGILKVGGTPTAPSSATISGGELDTGGEGDLGFRTATAFDTLAISSTISGETIDGITVSGAGTLILSGNNSFTGPINILGGTLELGSSGAFGTASGAVILQTGAILDTAGFGAANSVQVNSGTLRSSTGAGSLGGPVTINGGLTIDVAAGATLTLSNIIGGAGTVTKTSAGTAVLTGANSFPGNVTISAGTIQITNSSGLGTGPKTVNIASANRPSLALNATGANIVLDPSITFVGSSDGTTAASGGAQGGIVNLGGNNVINGLISLNNGGGGNLDVYVQGGTLTLAGGVTAASTATSTRGLVLDGPAGGMVSGFVSDGVQPLSLTKQGSGTWVVTGQNTFSGAVTIPAGDLQVNTIAPAGSPQALGQGTLAITLGAGSATVPATTGMLEYLGAADAELTRSITVNGSGGGIVKNSGGGLLTLAGAMTTSGRALTFTGGNFDVTGQIAGSAAKSTLNVVGANVVLANTNSYNGPTNVIAGGFLQNGVTNALPSATTLTLGESTNNTNGTYDLNGFDQTIGGLNSAGSGAQTVTNNGASGLNTLTFSGSGTFGGTIKDGASATTAVATTTGATQVLVGANTYSGTTTVNGGTLIVSGSLNGTASVAVNGGTLGGAGTITTSGNGNVTVGSAGILAPGNGGPGVLTLALGSGSLDLSSATASIGWLNFELGAGSDEISLTSGILNLGSGFGLSDFNFTDAGGFGQGTYVLFATNNPIQGTLGSNATGSVLGLNATLQFANGGDELVLNVVPEPGMGMTLLAGLGVLVGVRRFQPVRSGFNRRRL